MKVFEDEFSGTAIDPTKWAIPWYGTAPPADSYQVSNGTLKLTSRRSQGYKNVELNSIKLDGAGNITSPSNRWTYGYFQARSKLPATNVGWSAYWLNNLEHQQKSTSPFACPKLWSEIDIYETIGLDKHTQYTTLHRNTNSRCGVPDEERPSPKWMRCDTDTTPCDLTTAFHTWAVKWTPDRVTWYRDGAVVKSTRYHFTVADVPTFDSTNQPMFLNLWLHACEWGATPRCPDSATPDVITHEFDSVEVWQKP